MVVPPFENIAIIGLGLIGGSMALASLQRGYHVTAYNRSQKYKDLAETSGIKIKETIAETVKDADLIILAIPLPTYETVGTEVAKHIKPDATVIDIGSVKSPVRAAMGKAGLNNQYVATHPMAGNEHSGFGAATADLLKGAPWALTTQNVSRETSPSVEEEAMASVLKPPGSQNPNSTGGRNTTRYQKVYQYLTDTFDANIIELTDKDHDQVQALISGLPHILAVQLLNQVSESPQKEMALKLAAGSFKDGTRVAYTDPERTKALVEANRAEVAKHLKKTAADLLNLAAALESNQDTTDFFHQADQTRTTRPR